MSDVVDDRQGLLEIEVKDVNVTDLASVAAEARAVPAHLRAHEVDQPRVAGHAGGAESADARAERLDRLQGDAENKQRLQHSPALQLGRHGDPSQTGGENWRQA